jgi:hypothetical protein
MNDTQLDLLSLARVAAQTGKIEGRRAVLRLTRKYEGTELGQHLAMVCRQVGVPLVAAPGVVSESVLDGPRVLKASEVMDRLVVLACGEEARLKDYRVAFDFALADFGPKVVRGQLALLLQKGETEAASALAELIEGDERKSYADVGRKFIRQLAEHKPSGQACEKDAR